MSVFKTKISFDLQKCLLEVLIILLFCKITQLFLVQIYTASFVFQLPDFLHESSAFGRNTEPAIRSCCQMVNIAEQQ